MNLGLRGRRCIVTGGSKGIGLAAAEALAAEGADVALLARNAEALDRNVERIRNCWSVQAHAVPVDMTDGAAVAPAIDIAIARLGGVDALVNAAGASKFGSYEQITDTDWNEAFQLKVLGYVRAIRAVTPTMSAQRSGRIVNIVGMGGKFATKGYVLGCLNAALLHVTKTASDSLSEQGVGVVALNPGSTATDRIHARLADQAREVGMDVAEFAADFAAKIPLGRLGRADEIGAVVAFLCSDQAAYLTGSSVDADGGAMAGRF